MTGKGPAGRKVIVSDLSPPVTDILWHDGRLFISHRGKISVFEGGKLRDLVTDLPSLGDHSNNQMAVGPDGKLYFGQGSATNSGVVGVDNFAFGWVKKHPEVAEVPAMDVVLTDQVFETADPRGGSEGTAKTSAFQPFGKTVAGGHDRQGPREGERDDPAHGPGRVGNRGVRVGLPQSLRRPVRNRTGSSTSATPAPTSAAAATSRTRRRSSSR